MGRRGCFSLLIRPFLARRSSQIWAHSQWKRPVWTTRRVSGNGAGTCADVVVKSSSSKPLEREMRRVPWGRSGRRELSCIWVTPSEARAPLAMMRGCQPNCGRYLANLRERWTPAPPRGGKRYDRYNNERVNSAAPDACAEATPSLFDG